MIQRCINPNDKKYPLYGSRGIRVCKQWEKFENFLKDMGECPSGYSIDRTDNNKGYNKENCRWATPKEQARNRRNNHMISYNEKTQCLAAWTEETGIASSLISWRIKNGWSTEKALTTSAIKIKIKRNMEHRHELDV